MAAVSVVDILRGTELAWKVYQLGWSQNSSTSMQPFLLEECGGYELPETLIDPLQLVVM